VASQSGQDGGDRGEDLWEMVFATFGVREHRLLQAAGHRPYRRTILSRGMVCKISIRVGCDPQDETLQHEYEILKRCNGISGVPFAAELAHSEEAVMLTIPYIEGQPLMRQGEERWCVPTGVVVRSVFLLVPLLCRLSWRGVAHNDLKPWNVIWRKEGGVTLIDFDMASEMTPWRAFYRNLVALRGHLGGTSLLYIVAKLCKPLVPLKVVNCVRRKTGYMSDRERRCGDATKV